MNIGAKGKRNNQIFLLIGILVLAIGAIAFLNMANNSATEQQIPAGHSADDGHNH